jgi:predicted metal-dependent phosphoesterase TrpH
MPFKVDLHVHTIYSGDNEAEPEAMVEAAISCGLDGIAFTEHSSFEASEYAERLKMKYSGRISLFRGVEFSALEGHFLVFGVNTDRLSLWGAPAEELIRAVDSHEGVVVPSHPYRTGSGAGDLVLSLEGITAIEGMNGANIHPMNVRAAEAARSLGLPCTGGSDAHQPKEVGNCYTEFEKKVPEDGLVNALREGHYEGLDTRKVSRMAWLL